EGAARAAPGRAPAQRPLRGRDRDAHREEELRAGSGVLREGRIPVADERGAGDEAGDVGSDLPVLHAGEIADFEASRGLPEKEGHRVLARGVPRSVPAARVPADSARAQGPARRGRRPALIEHDTSTSTSTSTSNTCS